MTDENGAAGVPEALPVLESSEHGIIRISRVLHQHAEDLNQDTTIDDIDTPVPNNIKYLATLIHEAGHYWQWLHNRLRDRVPEYEFTNDVLETLDWE